MMLDTRLTPYQALIITGYTGILACDFELFHADVQQRLGRAIYTHELGSERMNEDIKEAYKSDFLALCNIGGYDE